MPGSQRFSREHTDFKRITTLTVVGGVIFAGIIGIAAFVLSFRPSLFRLDAGQVLVYRLKTTTTELAPDGREGRPAIDERTITLIGIGGENQVALLAEETRGRDRISLHGIESNGMSVLLDAAARPTSGSRAVGIFDLNLFALPPSATEQSWDVQLTYGLLPPAKQLVQAHAKRSKSSSNPEFQLRLPTSLEWTESVNSPYRQVRDLQCTYRYRSSQHAVDQATLRCTFAIEQPQNATTRRFRMAMEIDLIDSATLDENPARLREVAIDCAAATAALSDPAIGIDRRKALADNLRAAETGIGRLRQLADRLTEEVRRQPSTQTLLVSHAAPLRHQIQVAIGPEANKTQAEQLARTLIASGFTARVEPVAAGNVRVVVGPFIEKDPTVLERLQQSFPYLKPLWVEASAP